MPAARFWPRFSRFFYDSPWGTPVFLGAGALLCLAGLGAAGLIFQPRLQDLAGRSPAFEMSGDIAEVNLGESVFYIPRNYIRSEAGAGGSGRIALHALGPQLVPYTLENWERFESESAASRLVRFWLLERRPALGGEERFEQFYRKYVLPGEPHPAASDLRRYRLSSGSGRADEEVLTGTDAAGRFALLICFLDIPRVPSPGCRRTLLLEDGLSLTYGFKRAHLERWRELDAALRSLVARFREKPEG